MTVASPSLGAGPRRLVRPHASVRWAVSLGLLLLAFLLLRACGRLMHDGLLAVVLPAELDYGEGIIWQQAALIPGPRMYGDLQQYPFIVFHYPPFYHIAVRAAAMAGVPWLVAGRLISFVSAWAAAALAAGIVWEDSRPGQSWPAVPRSIALGAALVTAALFATFNPVTHWAQLMRVDMLACALEFLGMWLALRALRRPGLAYLAAVAFVLAAFTKQTYVLGAVAAFVALLPRAPRLALRAFLSAALLGGASLAALVVATDGGFLRHVVLYDMNAFSLRKVPGELLRHHVLGTCWPLLLIAVAMVCVGAVRVARAPWGERLRQLRPAEVMAITYFLLATASLVTLGKEGSNDNYLIPWLTSCAVLAGLAAAAAARALAGSPSRAAPALAVLALLLLQGWLSPPVGNNILVDMQFRREYAELLAAVRTADKPVLSQNMTVLMQAGKEVPWEPAIITQLTGKGLFDERKLLDLIEGHAFAFVLVGVSTNKAFHDMFWTPTVTAALEKAYPREQRLASMRILLPPEGP